MSRLDDDELEATRKMYGAYTKIIINLKDVDAKIKELHEWRDIKKGENDEWNRGYLDGELKVLNALKEGDLSKI